MGSGKAKGKLCWSGAQFLTTLRLWPRSVSGKALAAGSLKFLFPVFLFLDRQPAASALRLSLM